MDGYMLTVLFLFSVNFLPISYMHAKMNEVIMTVSPMFDPDRQLKTAEIMPFQRFWGPSKYGFRLHRKCPLSCSLFDVIDPDYGGRQNLYQP